MLFSRSILARTLVALLSLGSCWSTSASPLQDVRFFSNAACTAPLDITAAVNGTINSWQYWPTLSDSAVSRTAAFLTNGSNICVDQPFPTNLPAIGSGEYVCSQSGPVGPVGFTVTEYATPGCNRTNTTYAPFINTTLPLQSFQFSGAYTGQSNGSQCVAGAVGSIVVSADGEFGIYFTSAYATFSCATPSAPTNNTSNNAAVALTGPAWLGWTVVCLAVLVMAV